MTTAKNPKQNETKLNAKSIVQESKRKMVKVETKWALT